MPTSLNSTKPRLQYLSSSVTRTNFQKGMNKWIIHMRSFISNLSEMNWEACFSAKNGWIVDTCRCPSFTSKKSWTFVSAFTSAVPSAWAACLPPLLPFEMKHWLETAQVPRQLHPAYLVFHLSAVFFCFLTSCEEPLPQLGRWLLCAMWHDNLFFFQSFSKKKKENGPNVQLQFEGRERWAELWQNICHCLT